MLPNSLSHLHVIGCLCILFAIITVVYFPVLSSKATFLDDDQYLTENYLVQNPGFASARQFMAEVLEPSTVRGYYQPLSMISLMLDCALGANNNNLMPIHRTNLILHILNTGLVVLMLSLLFGRKWHVLGVGLLFGLAPTTVESIAWICERKTLLSTFFAISCLVFYILYSRNKKRGWFFFCVMSYLLALLSKPISVPLPILMLLLDFWPLRKLNIKTVMEKIPLFIIGTVSAVITMISQHATGSVQTVADHNISWGPLVLQRNIAIKEKP